MKRSNVAINHTALELVVKTNRARFIEIGFGGGALLNMAAACGSFPRVSGVDASLDMVKLVQRNLHTHIRQGKLEIQYGDIADLPFAPSFFDAVVSINTIYFWPSLKAGVSECLRILSNDGVLVLGFDDKTEMNKWPGHSYGFTMYDGEMFVEIKKNSMDYSKIIEEWRKENGIARCSLEYYKMAVYKETFGLQQ